jgi:hypothetical protein
MQWGRDLGMGIDFRDSLNLVGFQRPETLISFQRNDHINHGIINTEGKYSKSFTKPEGDDRP